MKGRYINLHGSANSRERLRQQERERYGRELQLQIEEKQRLKEIQRRREAEEDMRKVNEMKTYDSLGHKIREDEPNGHDAASAPIVKPDEEVSKAYTRGGNGIFGQPLTDAQKQANSRYRAELMEQIEERKRREEERKQQEKDEETREAARWVAEEKRKQELQDAEKAGLQANSSEMGPPTPASPKPEEPKAVIAGSDPRKHSVCLQVAIDNASPLKKQKPTRVVRKPLPELNSKKQVNSEELLAQVNQLKLELMAEKMRVQQASTLPERNVQVYDPRSVYLPFSDSSRFGNAFASRPAKVRRDFASFPNKSACQSTRKPAPIKATAIFSGVHSALPGERRGSLDSLQIQSNSQFLPNNEAPRTPSLNSLNLDELNKRNERRLNNLTLPSDLYKNEEPILQEFMAEEEAKLNFKR